MRIGDARVLDRLVRGRAWIALVAIGLMGIVFMQVSLLKLNAGISRAVTAADTLERQNSTLRDDISNLDSGERIQAVAAKYGMITPAAGDVHYLDGRQADAARAAAAIKPPSPVPGATASAVQQAAGAQQPAASGPSAANATAPSGAAATNATAATGAAATGTTAATGTGTTAPSGAAATNATAPNGVAAAGTTGPSGAGATSASGGAGPSGTAGAATTTAPPAATATAPAAAGGASAPQGAG
jgi:cell division protein FtsL